MYGMLEELLQYSVVRVLVHFLAVHCMFRIFAFVKTPTFYDETKYTLRLSSEDQRRPTTATPTTSVDEKKKPTAPTRRAARKSSSARARSSSPPPLSSTSTSSTTPLLPLVMVTGSSGRIGSAVVRCLAESGKFRIRAVDMQLQHQSEPDVVLQQQRRVCRSPLVEYRELNLVLCPDSDLASALEEDGGVVGGGVVGVIHCSGLFVQHGMMDTELHNALCFQTAKLLALCKASSACRAFVQCGSVFVCNNGQCNLNAIPPNTPYVSRPSTFWVRCQIEVEKMVLAANTTTTTGSSRRFYTCVNRMPFLYGANDDLLLTLMVHHEMSCFPSNNDVRSEFLYLKNAAHAHFCALQALLVENHPAAVVVDDNDDGDEEFESSLAPPPRAAGTVNIITQSQRGETCTSLEFWQRARRRLGVMRSFVILPTWIFYLVAAWVQLFHHFFCGQVFPLNPVWNSTWAVLDVVSHDGTYLGQVEALHSIGYRPLYTNDSSFDDMAKEEKLHHPAVAHTTRSLGHDPRQDIDWEPREMPGRSRNVLKTMFFALSGPGASYHERALMAVTFAVSQVFAAAVSVRFHFTSVETIVCLVLAGWEMTSAVVSIGPSSKRWFHLGGQLGMYMLILMFVDLVSSLVVFEVVFATMEWSLMVGLILVSAMLILTVVVPLSQQRSYSILMCLLFGAGVSLDLLPPVRRGMEWFLPLAVLKFLVCHSPRHEPYV